MTDQYNNILIDNWSASNYNGNASYPFITNCWDSGLGGGSDTNCYNREVVGNIYGIIFVYNGKSYQITFLITGYIDNPVQGYFLSVKFLGNPSKDLLKILITDIKFIIIRVYQSTYKVTV